MINGAPWILAGVAYFLGHLDGKYEWKWWAVVPEGLLFAIVAYLVIR